MSGNLRAEGEDRARHALSSFSPGAERAVLTQVGHGHIHDTWIAQLVPQPDVQQLEETGSAMDVAVKPASPPLPPRVVLQHLNTNVFRDPVLVARNLEIVTRHLREAAERRGEDVGRTCVEIVSTRDGASFVEVDGELWRALRYVEDTVSRLQASSADDAAEATRAFARFHLDLEGLDPRRLGETIPDFHHTPKRFRALDRALANDSLGRTPTAESEIEVALRWRSFESVLLDPLSRGDLVLGVAHNDAKITNVLFDRQTEKARCVIDLDTVMPGLALYDYGELVRSLVSRTPEDSGRGAAVEVDRERLEAVETTWLEVRGHQMKATERSLLLEGGMLMCLENGVRFLTDYLEGDVYYGATRPEQNLDRARTQLALLEALARLRPAGRG